MRNRVTPSQQVATWTTYMQELLMEFSNLLEMHGRLTLTDATNIQPAMRITMANGRHAVVMRSANAADQYDLYVTNTDSPIPQVLTNMAYEDVTAAIRDFLVLPQLH